MRLLSGKFDKPQHFRNIEGMPPKKSEKQSEGSCSFDDLNALFQKINQIYFDGFLDPPDLRWNPRLRSSAGRFIPGSRKYPDTFPPRIEIASYFRKEANSTNLLEDTMAHEMIHYWLWVRRRPHGHTAEFIEKMKLMGVSRFNPVPQTRPYKYLYQCLTCDKYFPSRKTLGVLACAACCKQYAQGKYDARFNLILNRQLKVQENKT